MDSLMPTSIIMHAIYNNLLCSSIKVDNVLIGEVTLTVEAALIIGTDRESVTRTPN